MLAAYSNNEASNGSHDTTGGFFIANSRNPVRIIAEIRAFHKYDIQRKGS
jgi:hypothetical protein